MESIEVVKRLQFEIAAIVQEEAIKDGIVRENMMQYSIESVLSALINIGNRMSERCERQDFVIPKGTNLNIIRLASEIVKTVSATELSLLIRTLVTMMFVSDEDIKTIDDAIS